MAFACSFTCVLSAPRLTNVNRISLDLDHLILYTIPREASISILSFCYLSMFEMGSKRLMGDPRTSRVVISGEGFGYSFSFSPCFLLGGRNVICAVHEGAYDIVFMLGMVM